MKLASRVKYLKPSPTLAITAKAKAMKAEGRDVVDFGAGEPDFDTPDNIKAAAIKAIEAGFTKYTPVGGINELKDAIIAKLKRDNRLEYEREEIIVSCGAKHVLFNIAQALFEPGDDVIVLSPYWVSYPPIITLAGARPIIVDTKEENGFKVLPEELEASITPRTKAIIFNSPSNPTGSVYARNEFESIWEVIKDRDIMVISDEIYEKIVYDSHFTSFASLGRDAKERTILVNGVSKSHSMTGWRIGYAAGNRDIIRAMTSIQSQSTSNPNSIAQKAGVEALSGDQSSLTKMVKEFDRRRRYIVERINKIDGLRCLMPEGAFYIFPNVSNLFGRRYKGNVVESSTDLASLLLEESMVTVVPGEAFGADGYLRLSYSTSFERIEEGLNRIEEFVSRLDE